MAGSKGQTFQTNLINYLLGKTTGSAPFDGTPVDTLYLALFTGPMGDGSGLTEEVSGSGYTRVAYDNTGWTGSNGTRSNTVEITFPTATGGSWGTVQSFAIMDVTTGGSESNIWFYGNLTVSKAIDDGDTAKFEVGDLVINED